MASPCPVLGAPAIPEQVKAAGGGLATPFWSWVPCWGSFSRCGECVRACHWLPLLLVLRLRSAGFAWPSSGCAAWVLLCRTLATSVASPASCAMSSGCLGPGASRPGVPTCSEVLLPMFLQCWRSQGCFFLYPLLVCDRGKFARSSPFWHRARNLSVGGQRRWVKVSCSVRCMTSPTLSPPHPRREGKTASDGGCAGLSASNSRLAALCKDQPCNDISTDV